MSAVSADGVTDAGPALAHAPEAPLALILDDSPFLALHLRTLLAARGLQASITANAAEVRSLASGASVIFVELELFDANGFAVTRELAEDCACPLVLLTGTGRSTDRQWGLRAGARAVLPRPVTAVALERLLLTLGGAEWR